MSIEFSILRSTVGQRILLLFVACALLPIGILTLVSFRSVTRELEEQSQLRLRQLAKSQVMSIVERLELLDAELQLVAQRQAAAPGGETTGDLGLQPGSWEDRFLEVSLRPAPGPEDPGPAAAARLAADDDVVRFNAHDSTLAVQGVGAAPPRVFLSRPFDSRILRAEVSPAFLWWGPQQEDSLPPASEVCILDVARTSALFCPGGSQTLLELLANDPASIGQFEWRRGDTEFLASYRTVNLEARFGFAGFTVVLSEEKSYLLQPLADFRRSFPAIIIASLGVVLLISIGQIRKQMIPLERLQSGTQRVAAGDFSTRVRIESRDEFEQLATDFNSMAVRLGKQFGALHSMNEIVQGVLSALDRTEIVRSLLANFDQLLRCEALSLTLIEGDSPPSARSYQRQSDGDEDTIGSSPIEMTPADVELLNANPKLLLVGAEADLPTFLQSLIPRAPGSVALFPVFVGGRLAAVIAAALEHGVVPALDDLARARQLADQVAVAFSNSELLQRLEDLSRGALTALARSIDAKSHWTAGHSERVARMAVFLGREMGLTAEELDILHRGSLLHDLGKIGVASEILDKPGKLTEAEMNIVRGHVIIGARILEPIGQLGNLMPLVLQHHEWFNGEGYPNRLAGEQIHPLARVLAVVDIYDALRSPRPYRDALEHEAVLQMITAAAGTQLDPQVVGAFLRCEAWSARDLGVAN